MEQSQSQFSHLANAVIAIFEKNHLGNDEKKISVNAVVSKVASWYEKFRNAMDYREEEVILRAAIERILKRRILLGGIGKTIAQPLIRELVWARYFQNESLPESLIPQVEKKIDLYLEFRRQLLLRKTINDSILNEWIFHLLSSEIETMLNPNKEEEAMSSLMYQIMQKNITIADDSEETRNAQVFIAVRRSFAKDDLGFLRFYMLRQFFGELTEKSLDNTVASFRNAYDEIERQLSYVKKDAIYSYVKNRASAFLILEDIMRRLKGDVREVFANEEELRKAVYHVCDGQYASITSKVRRAIVRSVLFILLTKVFFAFGIEGTFERLVYGEVVWNSIILNTTFPPLLMIFVSFFIRAPGRANSERIFVAIKKILYEEHPRLGDSLVVVKKPKKEHATLDFVFSASWLLAFFVSFGIIVFILSKLQFSFISQGIFLFFLAIVSFLTYRISLIPKEYSFVGMDSIFAPLVDFFFMPIIRVGRHLTEGIKQINILLFIFDFIIETPFKGIFAFFEQWFFFLHAKREELD